MNKEQLKEKISSFIIEFLYESKKALTTRSLSQYLYYEYYQAEKEYYRKKQEKIKIRNRINQTIWRLKKAGLIKEDSKKRLLLSKKGYLKYLFNKSNKFKKIKTKARKSSFYLIVFDISENNKKIRDLFRRVLYNFGAEKLQKSVFIIKGEEECMFIKELVKECNISDDVKIIRCNKIIN